MLRILRSILIHVTLLASVALGISGCVAVPYDDGYHHHHDRHDGDRSDYHDHWGHDRRW